MKQSCLAVEVKQNPVDYADIEAMRLYAGIAIPVHVHHHEDDAYGTEKVHDFRQCPQIVFLLHSKMELELEM